MKAMKLKQPYQEKTRAARAFNRSLNALTLLFVLFSFIFMSFSYVFIDVKVVGPSMQPTINAEWEDTEEGRLKQDIVYINVLAPYHNGDIIVVDLEGQQNEDVYIIKRLIASGGDAVNIVRNTITSEVEVYVNNILLVEDYVVYKAGLDVTLAHFDALKLAHPEQFDLDGNLMVPEDEIFYLGDNRGNSTDCSNYGPIGRDRVIGKVDIIIHYGDTFFSTLCNFLLKK